MSSTHDRELAERGEKEPQAQRKRSTSTVQTSTFHRLMKIRSRPHDASPRGDDGPRLQHTVQLAIICRPPREISICLDLIKALKMTKNLEELLDRHPTDWDAIVARLGSHPRDPFRHCGWHRVYLRKVAAATCPDNIS